MNYIEFKQSVLVTWKQEAQEPAVMHAFMGVASELGELFESHNVPYKAGSSVLDMENIWEELGDMSYYLAMLDTLLGLDVDALQYEHGDPADRVVFVDVLAELGQSLGEVADLLKKHYKYGQVLNIEALRIVVGDMFRQLCKVAVASEKTLGWCMDKNIDKLRKRYPDGFSELDAKLRKDKNDA